MFAFDQAIKVSAADHGTYHVNLLPGWCIGNVPHGGYLVAILLNAMKSHSSKAHPSLGQLDPIQISVAFVIKAQVGKARVSVKEVKIGRTYSNYQLTLQQQEEDGTGSWINLIHAFGIMGSFAKETGNTLVTTPRTLPRQSVCEEMNTELAAFRKVARNFDYWGTPGHSDATKENHWLAFKDRRPMDVFAMGLISDLMTPLPLRVLPDERGWYPTLSLDLQFKEAPSPDGLFTFLEVESESIKNGRFDITTRCFDANHRLIAISKHVALIVSASRNTNKRSARSKV